MTVVLMRRAKFSCGYQRILSSSYFCSEVPDAAPGTGTWNCGGFGIVILPVLDAQS